MPTRGLIAACVLLSACGGSDPDVPMTPAARAEVLVTGAGIAGANGLQVGPDGLLYVASVIGSEIVALDPDSGEVHHRLTAAEGVAGPDDLAFGPDGALFWTSILTGEVAGRTADGEAVVAARLGPGVNPITFSPDGRLFVAQCFFGDGLYEIDPFGRREPRQIADDLGPGCGLNGMDWGPDGRLYGPRWFHGEVVSVDVDSGERRVEADGFEVPAAVKFSPAGELHVLDTGAGRVVRIGSGGRSVLAELAPGLDNLAFDAAGRLFVSSFADGYVQRIDPDGSVTTLSPGGLAHPGGVAVLAGEDGSARVAVADLHALRIYDAASGEPLDVQRNILGVGALGSVLSVAASGDRLLLTAFTDGDVRVWDPAVNEVVSRFEGLDAPVSAIAYGGLVAVAEHGTGRVLGLDGAREVVLAEGLPAPTGLATDGVRLFVTDRRLGRVLEIARDGAGMPPRIVAEGLNGPEGLAWTGEALIVVEGETGRVLSLPVAQQAPSEPVLLAMVSPGSPPASEAVDAPQPPSLVFNGVTVHDRTAFVTGETGRVLYRIALDASPAHLQ